MTRATHACMTTRVAVCARWIWCRWCAGWWRLSLVACWVSAGCNAPASYDAPVQLPVQVHDPKADKPAALQLYDADGRLLPSDEVVAGLPLPRGLRFRSEQAGTRIYTSYVPLEKLQGYFGPRLITGKVKHGGGAITYVAAVPADARGGVVQLDVRLGANLSRPGLSFVELREIPPTPENPPSEAEIRSKMEKRLKYAE
jgi:hypothetical protein